MSDFRDRLKIEVKDLHDKIVKLEAFLDSEKFCELDDVQKSLLDRQWKAMDEYRGCLQRRLFLTGKY